MSISPFDNLPVLTKRQALDLLGQPIEKLKLSSDYYKAVFHLAKYPSPETEEALLKLIKSNNNEKSIMLAKRKALEVLARIGCKRAIPLIKECLKSDDPYLVENAAWSLQELGCKDECVNNLIGNLLDDPTQNLRVLIQSLSSMNAISQLPKIRAILDRSKNITGVKGAAISAIYNLSGLGLDLSTLKDHLELSNQNQRQSAVQDIIDSKAIELLPSVVITPISPSLRIRAIDIIWPNSIERYKDINLFQLLSTVINDNSSKINILKDYHSNMDLEDLISQLFSTDFNKCYMPLNVLKKQKLSEIWPELINTLPMFEKDYGALYFLVLLLREFSCSDKLFKTKALEILLSCLSDKWPQYMKFRPAAIITLKRIDCQIFLENSSFWLDETKEKNWISRFAAVSCFTDICQSNKAKFLLNKFNLESDSHRFVRSKFKYITSRNKYH